VPVARSRTTALASGRARGSFTTNAQPSSSRGSLPQWSRKASLCASRTVSCSSGPKASNSSPSSSAASAAGYQGDGASRCSSARSGSRSPQGAPPGARAAAPCGAAAWARRRRVNLSMRPRRSAGGSVVPSSADRFRFRGPATRGPRSRGRAPCPIPVLGDPAVRPVDALLVDADDRLRNRRVLLRFEDLFQIVAALKPDGLLVGGRPGNQYGQPYRSSAPAARHASRGSRAHRVSVSPCPFMGTG
jgi:hypothetical protein